MSRPVASLLLCCAAASCGWFDTRALAPSDAGGDERVASDAAEREPEAAGDLPDAGDSPDGDEGEAACAPGEPCDDGLFCTRVDECDDGGACAGRGDACDDGLACTDDACDEEADSCGRTLRDGFCLIGGECVADGTAEAGAQCAVCASGADPSGWSVAPAGTACDDGVGCTGGDECGDGGACAGVEDDAACGESQVCRPACFPGTGGCGVPPASLRLACESPVSPAAVSACTVILGDAAGQAGCIECTAKAGVMVLASTGFGPPGGPCTMDGWTFTERDNCTVRRERCEPGGSVVPCCRNTDAICTMIGSNPLLVGDAGRLCDGQHRKEWAVTRSFDTRGLTGMKLCFAAGRRATGSSDSLSVYAAAGALRERVYCLAGDDEPMADDVLYPVCVDLPAWTAGKPSVVVEFIAHSDSTGNLLMLDDVSLRGWSGGCPPTTRIAASESFSGCPTPLTDGWHGWTVSGRPRCVGSPTGLMAANDAWTIEKRVDASALDGEVTLCFDVGDMGAPGSDSPISYVRAEFDAGAGWVAAWAQSGRLGGSAGMRTICVNLSELDGRADGCGTLGIRFSLRSASIGDIYVLSNIRLEGAAYCNGAGKVAVGAVGETGGGRYDFTVDSLLADPLAAKVTCAWRSSRITLTGSATVDFR